jgi:hypothetical protein
MNTTNNIDDMTRREKAALEGFKSFYDHMNLEDALSDLKTALEHHERDGLEVREDVPHVIGLREDIDSSDVRLCDGCEDVLMVGHEAVNGYSSETHHVPETAASDAEQVCGACYESDLTEPTLTVQYSDEDMARTVGSYHDSTEGEFTVSTTRHDAWRVSHSGEPSEGSSLEPLRTDDVILSMSKDADDLKQFDEEMFELADQFGIRLARCTGVTSNVFSTTYSLYYDADTAGAEELAALKMAAASRAGELRDPAQFRATAMTGKDPEDLNDHDKLFVEAVKTFDENSDMTPREAVEKAAEVRE